MNTAGKSRHTGRPKIVIVAPRIPASFIKQDCEILSSDFDVSLISVQGLKSFRDLFRRVRSADLVYVWFLGRHALPGILLGSLFRIPVISVIGGFEVAWEADIKYGVKPRSVRESVLRWMLQKSNAIITVSKFSHALATSRFPELSHRMHLIHNAVDPSRFNYTDGEPRSGVLCIATLTASSIEVKNLRFLRSIASAMPDVEFKLVGPALDSAARQFLGTLPSNLSWEGEHLGDSLLVAYRRASVYVQMSRHESFSLALAESMACGCLPVISDRGALPEVGGPESHILSGFEVEAWVCAVRKSLARPESDRGRMREQVTTRFSTENRSVKLSNLISQILGTNKKNS